MSRVFQVALLGFSAFERSTLGSYFRLAASRSPRYRLALMIDEADFFIADAAHRPSEELVRATQRLGATVFIGARQPPGALHVLPRPIDPGQVLRALDSLLLGTARPAPQAPEEPPAGEVPTAPVVFDMRPILPPTAPAPTVLAPTLLAPTVLAPTVTAQFVLAPILPAPPVPTPAPGAVGPLPPARAPSTALLLRGPQAIDPALHPRLQALGLTVLPVTDPDEAVARLAEQGFDLILFDIEAAGSDPAALCRRLRRGGREALRALVMMGPPLGETERARAALAGADAYLGRPVAEAELRRLLAAHGLRATPAAASAPPLRIASPSA